MAVLGPLLLAAVTLIIVLALKQYHERARLAQRQEYAQFGGWAKLHIKLADEVWECPRCSLPCFSWKAVERHQDPKQCACAWLEEHGAELDSLLTRVRETLGHDDDDDEPGPEWNVSATVTGDEQSGEVDTMRGLDGADRGELEQFEGRAAAFRGLMERINKP